MKQHFYKIRAHEGYKFTNSDSLKTKCEVVKILSNDYAIIDYKNKKFEGRKLNSIKAIEDHKVKFKDYYKGLSDIRKKKQN